MVNVSPGTVFDWSTSYQAGSSSSASRSSSDDETEDELPVASRGRTFSTTTARRGSVRANDSKKPPSLRQSSPHVHSSGDSTSTALPPGRSVFTRSRSPAVVRPSLAAKLAPRSPRPLCPTLARFTRPKSLLSEPIVLLPSEAQLRIPVPFVGCHWSLNLDVRRFAESMLLLCSLLYAVFKISEHTPPTFPGLPPVDINRWISSEISLLCLVAFLYLIWTHSALSRNDAAVSVKTSDSSPSTPTQSCNLPTPPALPRTFDSRDSKRSSLPSQKRCEFSYMWMSVPKNYRDANDDGISTGLLLAPLIASALLIAAQRLSPSSILPLDWLIEAPATLPNSQLSLSAADALLYSRYNLINLATYCSYILFVHVCASRIFESLYGRSSTAPEGERTSVPRSEGLRIWYYVIFMYALTIFNVCLKHVFHARGWGIWQHMNNFDMVVASLFYQFALYVALRLAHRGFTLGELSLVCFGGVAVGMELLNITIARIWSRTTPFIKTYRLPTPLLTFQTALIAGTFLTGFLLSPFLVLSRHNAQRPLHRLRFPQEKEEKERNRRYYALGFYVGTALIVGGLIGTWTWWCLGRRNPWAWVLFYIVEGRKKWSRPALLAYWALLGSLSVAGWSRQMARSRKYRTRAGTEMFIAPAAVDISHGPSTDSSSSGVPPQQTITPAGPANSAGTLGMAFPNIAMPNLPNGTNVTNVATDLLDAADKRVPTLGLNARRKFFHALAVVMFIPGVAIDPAFAHLSFSVAFSLFIFAEYIRYFAIYPFGAAIHVFMNEFLDQKDSGTAILSHFYLLTGCAGSVWLESSTRLLQYTGIFILGVGDALASIVGKRIGTHRWSTSTAKTIEGSVALALSVVGCAWAMRIVGYAESFSTVGYVFVVCLGAVLEAMSEQNDNLTLPLYMWSMLVVSGVVSR
ncbi:hypothetical protein AMATHDRAFT_39008 [Amanita thiersii Skay4041]|uniref:dolichol kinase n=1 Tax=Amanita thiersii Skay4041 TaxID=703135 RepID=A0A2A9NYM9_9AGAR|nr:hypothetical protein AMATHDRAFT_39008 [Amanita thiersii Skay4041]